MQQDPSGANQHYRLYILGEDGRILEGKDIFAVSDDAAIEQAKQLAGSHQVEIWQGRRNVRCIAARATIEKAQNGPLSLVSIL